MLVIVRLSISRFATVQLRPLSPRDSEKNAKPKRKNNCGTRPLAPRAPSAPAPLAL